MKTLKNNSGDFKRVDDDTAVKLVRSTNWKYCGKEEYKILNKPKPKKSKPVKSDIENRGLSDKKIRKERKLAKANKK
jgi:hypothetical protein|tara:strand:- start:26 stop:256 length:231 start_codon:yes stop_codon:yes gene_type:complete